MASVLYTSTEADLARIPHALTTRAQWVLWRASDKIDPQTGAVIGLNKVPYTVRPDQHASSTDPRTWDTYQRCVDALALVLDEWENDDPATYRGGGLGYVFTADDPYCGVDLDHAVDPATGAVAAWAQTIVDQLQSYTQRSCSGTGLHVLIEGTLPPGRCQDGDLQMWDHARFFAMTGWHVAGTPASIEARQGALDALWCAHFGARVGDLVSCLDEHGAITNPQPWAIVRLDTAPDGTPYAQFAETSSGWPLTRCEVVPPAQLTGPCVSPPLSDNDILAKARRAQNAAKFVDLWEGRWQQHGYASESEADCALVCLLGFYTQNHAQLVRLFEASALCDDKWRMRPDYQQRTIRAALAQVSTHYQPSGSHRNGATPGPQAPNGAAPDDTVPLSDTRNAIELVQDAGVDLRYCHPWAKWLHWRGTHWQADDSGEPMRLAKGTIQRMIGQGRAWLARVTHELADVRAALKLGVAKDGTPVSGNLPAREKELQAEEKAALGFLGHCRTSLSDPRLKGMLSQAQSEPGIPVVPADLDRHSWLLNCANGTLDLRTGTLQPHTRTDLLTQCLTVVYDPGATCPAWDTFLWRIMGGAGAWSSASVTVAELQAADARASDLTSFLQRAVGWALTGDTSEECFFLLHGTGANGKSKFLGALLDLLGTYGLNTQAETFTEQRHNLGGSGATPDLARLRGARLVTVIESAEGRRLNEKLISQVTGRDPITARHLYQEPFQFAAQFKLFYACNHLPKVTSQNVAMWRRIVQIPFAVTIPEAERDLHLDVKLRDELPGILAWAVRGCLEWQRIGLQPPAAVREATEAYRHEQDVVQRFLDDACHLSPNLETKAGVLFAGFRQWCGDNHERELSLVEFGKRLDVMGYTTRKSNGVYRQGIGLDAFYATTGAKVGKSYTP